MKKAFTTSELLIGMTIIGVIAVLVMPGFIQDYQKKIYSAHMQKIYGLLMSAIEQSCADVGVSNFKMTTFANTQDGKDFLEKYIKTSGVIGSKSAFAAEYNSISGTTKSADELSLADAGTALKLSGGETIAMKCTPANSICTVTVDINGFDSPNVGGRDMFRFNIDTINNILSDSGSCTSNADGKGCLQLLIDKNWAMKEY